jgi:spermidine synthase
VFFGGLALGAAILGPLADRHSPFRFYGLLESGAGICALIAVILMPLVRNLYGSLSSHMHLAGCFRIFVQGTMAALILLPTTVMIGATLPALSRGLTVSLQQRFSRISRLYGINTIGAVLGTLLCGFLLLEHLGYFKTVMTATITNLFIGLSAVFLATRLKGNARHSSPPAGTKPRQHVRTYSEPELARASMLRKLILVMAGISGLAALGYEVIWFRILTFSVVADTYAFALMLSIYLLGIGGGSLIASRRLRHRKGNALTSTTSWLELGILELGVALLVVVGFAVLIWLNTQLPRPHIADPKFWWKILCNTSFQALVLILPVTTILGYIFPLVVSLYTTSLDKMGSHVGRVSAVNTIGAIIGSLGSAFFVIPLVGIQTGLLLMAGFSAAVGIAALIFSPGSRWVRLTIISIGIPLCIVGLILCPIRSNFGFLQIPTHKNAALLFYEESADQTIMVTEDLGDLQVRRLLINQQQATSTTLAGQRKNHLMGHLPLWACPEAQKALVICFGSGGTFGALGLYNLEQVDCVEICSAVIKAASFFRKWNGNVLSRKHVQVIIDDGRSYLLTTEQQYDIITLEPMHPGLMGVSALYSLEFYKEAKERLNPEGVLCQWVPLYSMTGQDARSLIATAVAVFPQSSLWLVGSEGLLLCARDSLHIGWNCLKKQMHNRRIHESLYKVYLEDAWTVLSGFLLGPQGLTDYVKGIPVVRDDHPFIEYTIPRHQHIFPWNDILTLARKRECPLYLINDISPSERDSLMIEWQIKKYGWIERDYGFAALSQRDFPSARKHLEKAHLNNPEDRYTAYFLKEIYWRYGVEFSKRRKWSEAIEMYKEALKLDPDDHKAHFYLAATLYNSGRMQESAVEAQKSLGLKPDYKPAKTLLNKIKDSH